MTLAFETVTVPLRTDATGVVRVGGTRVTLDTVMAAYKAGARAEDITRQYPVLQLADVYFVLGYYLRNRDEVESYLRAREERAAEARKQIESQPDWPEFEERLRALRASGKSQT